MSPQASEFALGRALVDPAATPGMDLATLSQVVSQGRITRLLASLGAQMDDCGALSRLPHSARRHFDSAELVHTKQRSDLAYDCESIRAAMDAIGEKLVLLKGGAYIRGDLRPGRGRLITDIDIIVPREKIPQAEQALAAQGWEQAKLDPYNESYYRRWSHETPALVNPRRGTTLDLHHNILPPTAGPDIDATLLFEQLQDIGDGIHALSDRDMLIHSATHLFHEGEFHHGLRDLWDIHQMLGEFPTRDSEFWQGLVPRARELQLEESVFHALHYSERLFGTPIPAAVRGEGDKYRRRLRRPLMDFLFRRAFRPTHPDCALPMTGAALNLLYIRSHYLRMPLYLLLPHLARKAWMSRTAGKEESLDKA
ncbi:MAG: nucleotidyltransferase family protein [Halioglobus sp.]|nr:nucleotidyltransferase family protein [Halioglobus sp.]